MCIGNSSISQLAGAIAGGLRYEAKSACIVSAKSVNQTIVGLMGEIGMDISGRKIPVNKCVSWSDVTIKMGRSIGGAFAAPLFAKMQKTSVDNQMAGQLDKLGK
ncbi:MAG: hypothetical protein QXH56_04515 [Thermoprotei archaeon]